MAVFLPKYFSRICSNKWKVAGGAAAGVNTAVVRHHNIRVNDHIKNMLKASFFNSGNVGSSPFVPESSPVAASKKAPVQKLATSAPLLACWRIQAINPAFSRTYDGMSPLTESG